MIDRPKLSQDTTSRASGSAPAGARSGEVIGVRGWKTLAFEHRSDRDRLREAVLSVGRMSRTGPIAAALELLDELCNALELEKMLEREDGDELGQELDE